MITQKNIKINKNTHTHKYYITDFKRTQTHPDIHVEFKTAELMENVQFHSLFFYAIDFILYALHKKKKKKQHIKQKIK